MNEVVPAVVGLLLGGAVGALIGWLAAWRRASTHPPDQPIEGELRRQLAQRETETRQLQEQLVGANARQAAAEASLAAGERLLGEQRDLHERSRLELHETQAKAVSDLRDAFKALSADALKQTHPEFLRLANETLGRFHETAKGDLAQRQQAIATLVKPLEEQLQIYQQRLQQSELSQSTTLGEVRKHLEQLSSQSHSLSQETLQLRRVLSSNQARGRWGEETLRRVVESAGLSSHCDFTEQPQSGDSKPDLLIHLPGDRLIIIDAKVPDLEFLDALEQADATRREEALAAHAARLRLTIKALGDRDYPRQFPNALDAVVLFLPAESLLSTALEADRGLIVWAAERQVLLASPASLIALLRAVSISWQQHAQSENARAICEAAQELFTRVCRFTEHLERIRSGLERANHAFNEAVGSYDRMLRPSGEKLTRLGAAPTGRALANMERIDTVLRSSPAAENELPFPSAPESTSFPSVP